MENRLPEMTLIEKIPLENGLALEVWDLSRPIAADTSKVELLFRIAIPLRPEDFPGPAPYARTREVFGEETAFECRLTRSFVRDHEVQATIRGLREGFRADTLPYLRRSHFPRCFALSKYREIEKHPFRYRETLKETA